MTPHDAMLARCTSLAVDLADRAADGEALRRLPDATIADAIDADLLRMVVPRSLGGLGLGIDTLAQSTRILASGCPASAWTLSFFVMHNWIFTRFDAEFYTEIFSSRPWVLAAAPLSPTGAATPVAGGYRLSGRWEWATGIEHSDWVMVHALVDRPGELDTRFLELPRDGVEVADVWHTSGMRATGSNTVIVNDQFVPEIRTVGRQEVMSATTPSLAGDAMGPHPLVPVLALVAAAPALGAAEGCVELFRDRLSERVLAYTLGDKQADQPAARVRLATARAEVRAARAVWEHALHQLSSGALTDQATPSERVAIRLAAASTVRLARQAISTVCEGSGGSIYFTSSPLQRLQRDVEVLKGHAIFDWDRCAELAGRIELGFEPSPMEML